MLIRKIKFVLENCEIITIDGKYIGSFCADDIRKKLARFAANHVSMYDFCHAFSIEIHKDANKEHSLIHKPDGSKAGIFDRLMKYDDITGVEIYLYNQYDENERNDTLNDTVHKYAIAWGGDSRDNNAWQHSKIADTGWFYMVIGKDMNLEETFPSETFNDKEYADHRASIFVIGDKYWEKKQKEIARCKKIRDEGEYDYEH